MRTLALGGLLGLLACAPAMEPKQAAPAPALTETARAKQAVTPARRMHVLGHLRGGVQDNGLTRGSIVAAPAPAPARGAALGAAVGTARAASVVALLGRDEEPAPPDRAYGLILGDRGPRTLALCQAMRQRMDFYDPQAIGNEAGPTRPIYWIMARTAAEIDTITAITCADLVAQLDLTRTQRHGLDRMAGPKLRALAERDGVVIDVLLDLSDQEASASEMDRAVGIWADLMASDPHEWQARVATLGRVESIRGFLVHVGAPLSNMLGMQNAQAAGQERLIPISR